MNSQIKVGVVGGGNMGRHHIRNYSEIPESRLVAVADRDPKIAGLAAKHGAKFYSNHQEMFKSERLDAVSIVVPTPLHLKIGQEAMSKGIHTLVEKPIASTEAEAEQLIGLAKKNNVIFTVGHIERYNPVVKRLRELVLSGRLGEISSVVSQRLGGFPTVEPKTDVVVDLAVHDIDIISYILDHPPRLLATHASRTFHSREIDSAELLMSYGDASGFIQANWVTPIKIRRISVTGSRGYVEANYITQEIVFYEHTIEPPQKVDFSGFVGSFGEPRRYSEKAPLEEPLCNELKAFLNAIATGSSEHIVDAEDAKLALVLALTAAEKYKVKEVI